MKQGSFVDLTLPTIYMSMANNVDFEDVINEFKKLVPFNHRRLL